MPTLTSLTRRVPLRSTYNSFFTRSDTPQTRPHPYQDTHLQKFTQKYPTATSVDAQNFLSFYHLLPENLQNFMVHYPHPETLKNKISFLTMLKNPSSTDEHAASVKETFAKISFDTQKTSLLNVVFTSLHDDLHSLEEMEHLTKLVENITAAESLSALQRQDTMRRCSVFENRVGGRTPATIALDFLLYGKMNTNIRHSLSSSCSLNAYFSRELTLQPREDLEQLKKMKNILSTCLIPNREAQTWKERILMASNQYELRKTLTDLFSTEQGQMRCWRDIKNALLNETPIHNLREFLTYTPTSVTLPEEQENARVMRR